MKDESIKKDIYCSVILTKAFEIHVIIRKFLYEKLIDVQDKIYLDGGVSTKIENIQPREHIQDETGR